MNELIYLVGEEGKRQGEKVMPSFFIARISKVKPNIEIHFNNLTVGKSQLIFTESFKNIVKGVKTKPSSNHYHDIDIPKLKIGDEVLIYLPNDRDVLIIDRVVR